MSENNKALVPAEEKPQEGEEQREVETPKRAIPLLSLIAILLVLAALALFGGGSYYAYQLYVQQQAQLNAQDERLAQLDQAVVQNDATARLETLKSELGRQADELGRMSVMQRRLDTLEESVQASHDLVNRAQRDWVIAEVDYLIRIANQRLRLMRDYNGAVAALKAADQRLRELADPSLMPVRESLADDIQALRDFERPDLIGIALSLDRLISHLKPMPLAMPASEGETVAQQGPEREPGLKGMLNTAWQTLSNRVTVRHYQEGVEAMPDQESELMMNQVLRLRLESARVNVLRQDDQDFHRQLQAALEILDNYYREEHSTELRTEIQRLNAIELRPELPDITLSLKKLQRLSNRPRAQEQAQ